MYKEINLFSPYMKSNPYLAIFFSFVQVDFTTIPWLLNFFTSPFAFTKSEKDEFDMSLYGYIPSNLLDDYFLMCCPFVEICHINQILLNDDIIKIIENAINSDYCPAIVVNPHFISAYGEWKIAEHDLLLCGYDSEKRVLLCKDFFPPSYMYSQSWVTYEEFIASYRERNTRYNLRFLKKKNLVTYPSAKDTGSILKEVMGNYLNSQYRLENPYYPLAYQSYSDKEGELMDANKLWIGINIYKGIEENLAQIPNKFWIMLIDGKRLILDAISLIEFCDREKVKKLYEEIVSTLYILLNMNVKYLVKGDTGIINRMRPKICEIEEKEEMAIQIILDKPMSVS